MTTWNKVDELTFDKELLPIGDAVRWIGDDREETEVRIRRDYLEQLVRDFDKFQEVGVRVPVFKGHKEDPDLERGLVKKVFIKPNEKGVDAGFVRVQFHSKEAAQQGTKVDVSAYCPPKFKDGRGNVYRFPLKHVALTSSPVLPGLSGFQPVVLAFEPDTKVPKMNDLIDEILTALEITAPEGSDEEAKLRLILQAIKDEGEGEEEGEEEEAPVELSLPPVLVRGLKSARETRIDGLVNEEIITPAHGDKLRKQYCSKDALAFDLKLDTESGETEFDRTVDNLREQASNRPLTKGDRTQLPKGGVKLSKDPNAKKPATVRLMEERAERRAKKQGK